MTLEPPLPDAFVVTGGLVIDGTGREPEHLDVVVDRGRLELRPPGGSTALPRLDVDGLAVSPGFIDVHSHADLEAMTPSGPDPLHPSRLRQGVTTEVTGNCGFSPFPVPDGATRECTKFLGFLFGSAATAFPDLGSYATEIETHGLASNIAPLVGHGTLRAAAIGMSDRAPTSAELESMSGALDLALSQGAFGLSTGLCYTPATFAASAEIEALAHVVARAGATYATHVRNETDGVREALAEALAVSRATGVRLHISHLKAGGRRNWGGGPELLTILAQARERGIDVTADAYPYTAGSTMLHSLLPPWLIDDGTDTLLIRLADPTVRQRVDSELESGVPGWQNLGSAAGWDRVTIASSPKHPQREGKSIDRLRDADDRGPADTIARLLLDEGGSVVAIIEAMDESDMREIVAWPHTLVGSDGIPLPGKPHPRLTGTFPRVLDQHRTASLSETVHKMTGYSARRFQIPQRGVIRDGHVADIVVFDPDTITDLGTYADPWQAPRGIPYVFIAGRAAVWEGEVVDASAGAVLRRR
jgi:N-acyl-D-aspartate/D-glutamate deacylase